MARDRAKVNDDNYESLMNLFNSYIKKAAYIENDQRADDKRPSHIIPITALGMVQKFCNLMKIIVPSNADGIDTSDFEPNIHFVSSFRELTESSRSSFDEFLKSIAECSTPSFSYFESFYISNE